VNIPPNSPQLEALALQAILQNEQAAAALTVTLTPEVFYLDVNRFTFEAASQCVRRGIACDVATVSEELAHRKQLDTVGRDYLLRLVDGAPSPNWLHHARLLQATAERRRIIQAGERIAADGYAEAETVEDYRAKAEALLFAATQREETSEIITPAQLVASLDDDAAPRGLTTGFRLLDEPATVLADGRLVVLAGRPGIGKTALACAILERHALGTPPVPTLFFSCEQTGREIAQRILALRTHRTLHEIQTGTPSREAVERLAGSGLLFSEAGAPTLGAVLGQIRAARATRGVRLGVLDHVGKVVGSRRETRNLEVGEVARGLKAIAKDCRIPVLALCQLNRLVESRNVKRPHLSDLRESGEIEQEADAVAFLWTPEENWTQAQLPVRMTLAKNRHGAPGEWSGKFDRPRVRFCEAD